MHRVRIRVGAAGALGAVPSGQLAGGWRGLACPCPQQCRAQLLPTHVGSSSAAPGVQSHMELGSCLWSVASSLGQKEVFGGWSCHLLVGRGQGVRTSWHSVAFLNCGVREGGHKQDLLSS